MTEPTWPEATETPCSVVVYICPTNGCGNYYAASTFSPADATLTEVQASRNETTGQREERFSRVECPQCRASRNISVDRVPYIVTQVVSLEAALAATKKELKRIESKDESTSNKDVPVRGKSLSTKPRWQVPESPRPLISRESYLRRTDRNEEGTQ